MKLQINRRYYLWGKHYLLLKSQRYLLELKHPEEMDERYKECKFDYLSIILEPEYKEKSDSFKQVQAFILKSSSRQFLIKGFSQKMPHKYTNDLHINGIELVL
ncbi:hypothetical protein COJ52_31125 [Bacillus cereus]|nr:hypothetical protein COI81_30140 [Bacillus cereus]PFM44489.1 hypothetical protein COJ52_31125 [Bacillus cereus]PGS25849.1 hypothetical protein COC55_13700 [Bacillus cereus]